MADEQKPLQLIPDERTTPAQLETEIEEAREPLERYGTLSLSREQQEILEAPIPVEDVDILVTGEIYASQVQYRRRLNQCFRPGGWAMVEKSAPTIRENIVMQKWGLYASGVLVSTAWGEQEYFPNNPRMSYATALEAAKSNALTRCCKDLGIASECWDKHYAEQFKVEHCESTWQNNRKVWRRKDAKPQQAQTQPQADRSGGAGQPPTGPPARGRQPARTQPAPPSDQDAERARQLTVLINETKSGDEVTAMCKTYNVEHLEELNDKQYEEVRQILLRKKELGK